MELGSSKFKVVMHIRAMNKIPTKKTIGIGSYSSLIIGLNPVKVLAQILQMPIAVALFSIGNILLSIKLAKYDDKKAIAIPNLPTTIEMGIHLLKKSTYSC